MRLSLNSRTAAAALQTDDPAEITARLAAIADLLATKPTTREANLEKLRAWRRAYDPNDPEGSLRRLDLP